MTGALGCSECGGGPVVITNGRAGTLCRRHYIEREATYRARAEQLVTERVTLEPEECPRAEGNDQ